MRSVRALVGVSVMMNNSCENLPALIPGQGSPLPPDLWTERSGPAFVQEPPIEIIIDSRQIKDRIIDYLGAVLARCWLDRSLLYQIEMSPHRTLRSLGILLPDEIDIKVERFNLERPRLVIFEYNQERSYRRRVCYLQLIMMAGK